MNEESTDETVEDLGDDEVSSEPGSDSDDTEESSSEEGDTEEDVSDGESSEGDRKLWYPWYEDSEDEDLDEGDDGWELKQIKFRRYRPTLRAMRDGDASLRESIYNTADRGLICFLCEICHNVLRGKVSLLKREKTTLRIFRDQIRLFASPDMSWVEKKELLCKHPDDTSIPVLLSMLWGCCL
jgi:hypothetical protein